MPRFAARPLSLGCRLLPRARIACVSLACAGFVGLALPAPNAEACGRAIELEVEPATVLLAEADKLLDDGNFLRAARKADESQDSRNVTWNQKWWRQRILAEAAIRSGGEIAPALRDGRAKARSPKTKQQNLSRAVASLKRMMKKKKHAEDPVLLGLYGEGLAQVPGKRELAFTVLTRLADDDLITHPKTWAALASLREARGDEAAAAEAQEVCKAMSEVDGSCVFHLPTS